MKARVAGTESSTWVESKLTVLLTVCAGLAVSALSAAEPSGQALSALVERAGEVRIELHAANEYRAAVGSYREILNELEAIEIGDDDAVDARLLERHVRTRLFELEELRLHEVVPGRYFALSKTDNLFVRPCAQPDRAVREARDELQRLPKVLANARLNLERPARVWTENALYIAYYAQEMMGELDGVCIDDPELRRELAVAGAEAGSAIASFAAWLESDLLPRSDRSPAWTPEQVEFYQFEHEGLERYGVDEMLELARREERETWDAMEVLAQRIHPSGDLATVWELMKEEAPAWPEVQPMAERYVALADAWLRGAGSHLIDIPERFDYGVVETSPMGRRVLSWGRDLWTHTGRAHLGLLRAHAARGAPDRRRAPEPPEVVQPLLDACDLVPRVGRAQRSAGDCGSTRRDPDAPALPLQLLEPAWSFYLEKLFEDEGYFEAVLPHVEALKTRMARLQMRMWRVQRILTKLRMAKGEMTFDEAVAAYIEKIGMEPGNAFIEVQRDSQSPSPPGREIVGEREILALRGEYERRFGEHYRIKHFHEALLRYGELPLPTLRQLMFGDL